MKERPILFNGPMVRSILEGRKTMTRRVVKLPENVDVKQLHHWHKGMIYSYGTKHGFIPLNEMGGIATKAFHKHHVDCPYGAPGDRLWVRETWVKWIDGAIYYRSSEHPNNAFRWSPSIHMPRWASRLTLEVVKVRVERLQKIAEEDAKAEGVNFYVAGHGQVTEREIAIEPGYLSGGSYRLGFIDIWQEINQERGYGWDVNPWVWVIEFKRVEVKS